ncbi:MAG: hypothetical protein ACD_79C01185G0001 [uncultured bacterium]|nr:MAG: hypothetical protein ACD_79C01185G0001 [uncultured bacterium]
MRIGFFIIPIASLRSSSIYFVIPLTKAYSSLDSTLFVLHASSFCLLPAPMDLMLSANSMSFSVASEFLFNMTSSTSVLISSGISSKAGICPGFMIPKSIPLGTA